MGKRYARMRKYAGCVDFICGCDVGVIQMVVLVFAFLLFLALRFIRAFAIARHYSYDLRFLHAVLVSWSIG